MAKGLLFGADHHVAVWAWRTFNRRAMSIDRAVGIVADGQIIGAAIWQNFNGHNVDLSYYGPYTLTVGIVRNLACFTLDQFDPSRVTVMTAKTNKHIAQFLQHIGAQYEGVSRCYYGSSGRAATAMRYAMKRKLIEKLAGRSTQ